MDKISLKKIYSQLNNFLEEKGYDAMVITSYENCYYLSGVFLYYNAVIIKKDEEPVLLVKYIDYALARKESSVNKIVGYSPYKIENQGDILIGSYAESMAEILKELGCEKGKICIPDYWAVLRPFMGLKESLPNAEFIIENPLLEEIRMIKQPYEIKMINKAVNLLERAYSNISHLIKPGTQENEIASEIAKSIWRDGGELWHAILASGENSLLPHAKITENKLKDGDNIVIDLVAANEMYYGGLTRTFVAGEISKEKEEVFDVILDAAKHVYDNVKIGMPVKEIALTAINYYAKKGYDKNIKHAFGHSIGTFPHESPILNTSDNRVLKENMVFCFEPAIYINELGGFRLGDLIVMTQDGFKKLSNQNRQLKASKYE